MSEQSFPRQLDAAAGDRPSIGIGVAPGQIVHKLADTVESPIRMRHGGAQASHTEALQIGMGNGPEVKSTQKGIHAAVIGPLLSVSVL